METQIYIADLAAYNAGFLRGKWIDANQTPDELSDEVYNMLLESPESNIPCTVCNECGHILRGRHNVRSKRAMQGSVLNAR